MSEGTGQTNFVELHRAGGYASEDVDRNVLSYPSGLEKIRPSLSQPSVGSEHRSATSLI